MKKESLADKLARKSFESAAFQQSWQVHLRAFGPILEPAFEGNYQAKVHLCAGLNHISKKQIPQGLTTISKLDKFVQTDADKCAYAFFLGLCCELSGKQDQMVALYTMANQFGHKLYLPYLNVGKFYLNGRMYEKAEENYRSGIECFTGTGLSEQDKIILGSAYGNLASCLLQMHRYEEAEEALNTSRSLQPVAPGRAAIEAPLYALRGEAEKVNACLETLKAHAPAAVQALQETTDRILAKTDPLFFPQQLDEEKIAAFWNWFGDYEDTLKGLLSQEDYEEALTPVGEKLLETFPFLEEIPNVALGKNEQGWVIRLQDLYAVAVMDAYEKLLEACPQYLKDAWQFDVAHT